MYEPTDTWKCTKSIQYCAGEVIYNLEGPLSLVIKDVKGIVEKFPYKVYGTHIITPLMNVGLGYIQLEVKRSNEVIHDT